MKKHLKPACKDLINCPGKRHLKLCKRYVPKGSCIFGKRCDYLHKEKEMSPDQNSLNERVEELEKVVKEKSSEENKCNMQLKHWKKMVKAMSCKVLKLEEEILKIKKDSKENENKDLEEPFKDTSNFLNSTPVSAKQKLSVVENKVIESRKEKFKCENCDCKCQKESTLTKHINPKHMDQ